VERTAATLLREFQNALLSVRRRREITDAIPVSSLNARQLEKNELEKFQKRASAAKKNKKCVGFSLQICNDSAVLTAPKAFGVF
jgi:hypothetical protein